MSAISDEREQGRVSNESWARFQAANLPAMLSALLGWRLGGDGRRLGADRSDRAQAAWSPLAIPLGLTEAFSGRADLSKSKLEDAQYRETGVGATGHDVTAREGRHLGRYTVLRLSGPVP